MNLLVGNLCFISSSAANSSARRLLNSSGSASKRALLSRPIVKTFHSSGTSNGSTGLGSFCTCCGMYGANHVNPWKQQQQQPAFQLSSSRSFISMGTDEVDGHHPHVDQLLLNNKKWIHKATEDDENFLHKLSAPQKPRFLYIGCSDSRVPANEILGLGPGEVFVHRNVGNLVPGNDLNVLSVIEFAVGHLNIKDIIVTGHYNCGAIDAASSRQDLGTLEHWLRQIRDVYRIHKDTLDHFANSESKRRALVELNVVEQCLNVFKTGIVQRKRNKARKALVDAGKNPKKHEDEIFPRIHGMVFNPQNGRLKYIPVDFKHRVGSLDHIYGLYDMPTRSEDTVTSTTSGDDSGVGNTATGPTK